MGKKFVTPSRHGRLFQISFGHGFEKVYKCGGLKQFENLSRITNSNFILKHIYKISPQQSFNLRL